MKRDSGISAVVFDLDGVYFENGTKQFVEALHNNYGLTQSQIADVYFKSNAMKQFKRNEITGSEFWQYAIEEWQIEATREELVRLLLSGYTVRRETQEYVQKLRQSGIKTAVCTNNFSDRLNGLRKLFRLDQHFDRIVASCELGVLKPEPQIFQALAQSLDLQPHQIVMSDDKASNIAALRELGFEAFLYEDWVAFVDRVDRLIS